MPIDAPPPAVPPPESPAVDIGAKLTELMQELADTKEELQRRKDSAMRKEVRLQQEVSDLKDSLEEALGNRTQVQQMQRVRKVLRKYVSSASATDLTAEVRPALRRIQTAAW